MAIGAYFPRDFPRDCGGECWFKSPSSHWIFLTIFVTRVHIRFRRREPS
jgi:hypothetical protein